MEGIKSKITYWMTVLFNAQFFRYKRGTNLKKTKTMIQKLINGTEQNNVSLLSRLIVIFHCTWECYKLYKTCKNNTKYKKLLSDQIVITLTSSFRQLQPLVLHRIRHPHRRLPLGTVDILIRDRSCLIRLQ